MISHANKGIIFNMLCAPYPDDNYEAYKSEEIKRWLKSFDHRKIEIIENYMNGESVSGRVSDCQELGVDTLFRGRFRPM